MATAADPQRQEVASLRARQTLVLSTPARSITAEDLVAYTRCSQRVLRRVRSGNRSWKKRSVCARSFRSLTRCLRWSRSARIPSSCLQSRRARLRLRGTTRIRLLARSRVLCRLVSYSFRSAIVVLTEHGMQLRQMEGHLLRLDAQRVCGLASDMTLGVSFLVAGNRGSNLWGSC